MPDISALCPPIAQPETLASERRDAPEKTGPQREDAGGEAAAGHQDGIVDRLAALFVERLHIEVPSPDTDLFATGILDSLQLVELLCQLEQQFGCQIALDDLDLDDLRTLTGIAGLVAAHNEGRAPPSN